MRSHRCAVCSIVFAASSWGASPEGAAVLDEIERLKTRVAAQEVQIKELRQLLETQSKLLAKALPDTFAAPAPAAASQRAGEVPALPESTPAKAPSSFHIGGAAFTPTGFLDFSQVWRSGTVASGLSTNFAAVPFFDTVEGNRRQTLASAAYWAW